MTPAPTLDEKFDILNNLAPATSNQREDRPDVAGQVTDQPADDGSWNDTPPFPDARGAAIEAARPEGAPAFDFESFKNAVAGAMNDPHGMENIQQGIKGAGGAVLGKGLDIGMAQAPLTDEQQQQVRSGAQDLASSTADSMFQQARQGVADVQSGDPERQASAMANYDVMGAAGGDMRVAKSAVEGLPGLAEEATGSIPEPAVRRPASPEAPTTPENEGFPPQPSWWNHATDDEKNDWILSKYKEAHPFMPGVEDRIVPPAVNAPALGLDQANKTVDASYDKWLADNGLPPREVDPHEAARTAGPVHTQPPLIKEPFPASEPVEPISEAELGAQRGRDAHEPFDKPGELQGTSSPGVETKPIIPESIGRPDDVNKELLGDVENLRDPGGKESGNYPFLSPGEESPELKPVGPENMVPSGSAEPLKPGKAGKQPGPFDEASSSVPTDTRGNPLARAEDLTHNDDGSITLKPKGLPPIAGGSEQTMATWVKANPSLPEKIKTAAMAIPTKAAQIVEPFKHAGPEVQDAAQKLAGEYDSAAVRGSIKAFDDTPVIDIGSPGWTRDLEAGITKWSADPNVPDATARYLQSLPPGINAMSPGQMATAAKTINRLEAGVYVNTVKTDVLDAQKEAIKNFLVDLDGSGRFAHANDIGEFSEAGAPPKGWTRIGSGNYYADPMTAAGLNHMFAGADPEAFLKGTATYNDLGRLWGRDGGAGASAFDKFLDAVNIVKENKLGGSAFHAPATAWNVGRTITNEAHPLEAARVVKDSLGYMRGGLPRLLENEPRMKDVAASAAGDGMTGLNFKQMGAGGYGQEFDIAPTKDASGNIRRVLTQAVVGSLTGAGAGYVSGKDLPDDERRNRALQGAAIGAGVGAASNILIRKGIFQNYIPVLKLNGYDTLTRLGVDGKEAASLMNDAAGGQNLIAMGRSPGFQRIMRAAMLGPDFDEGAARMALTHGPTSAKYIANMAMTVVGIQAVQDAIYRYGASKPDGQEFQDKHFTWDNGPRHILQLDISPLLDAKSRTYADPNGRQGTHQYFIGVPGLGPVGSTFTDFASGDPGSAIANHAGVAPSIEGQLAADKGAQGGQIVPTGKSSFGDEAANVAAGQLPIGMSALATAAKEKDAGPDTRTRIGLGIASQGIGGRFSTSRAESPAINEAAKLGLGGQAGWPPVVKKDQEMVIPSRVVGRGAAIDRAIDLTPAEAQSVNEHVDRRVNSLLDQYHMTYAALPANGPDLNMVRGAGRRSPTTEQIDLEDKNMVGSKRAFLQAAYAKAHEEMVDDIAQQLQKSGTWDARVHDASEAALTRHEALFTGDYKPG